MKRKYWILGVVLLALLLTACQKEETAPKETENVSDYYIYYLDNNETQVVREPFVPESDTLEGQIEEYEKALKEKNPSDLKFKKALPDYVEMNAETRVENEQLTLNFDSGYLNLKGATEVLCRAAIVKTFCQIDGVEYVQFIVDGQPLKLHNDLPVGFMKAEDFIDNTGGETKYEQNAVVILYFSDATGKNLVDTRVRIKYDGTIPLEELVINQLIKGPDTIDGVKEGEILRTIPETTVLNRATTKDGVCYLDLNSEFLKSVENVDAMVTLYSVVNSLIEIPDVNKVQLTIDGATEVIFDDGLKLDAPLERNLDIVKKSE